MSRYDELSEKVFAGYIGQLLVELVNVAPDIAALWKAADSCCGSVGHNGHDERQDDGECEACQLRNALEALRPLFGEECP